MLIPKKSLGQNFLIDKNIILKIINLIKITNQIIIEIGPGTGKMTDEIIKKKPNKLLLIEKDKELYCNLKKKYKDFDNIKIINIDAMKYNFNNLKNFNIISNLPYNISTKIIINLLKNFKNINEMVFMVQKEVAKKMNYKNNIKKNKLNFFIEATSNYKMHFNVSNKVFYPKPKVNSTVIKIIPKKIDIDFEKLHKFSIKIFINKRKKIKNIIKFNYNNFFEKKIINLRAEDLKTKELLYLFNNF